MRPWLPVLVLASNLPTACAHGVSREGAPRAEALADPALENCLRITVGLPRENAALVRAVKEIVR